MNVLVYIDAKDYIKLMNGEKIIACSEECSYSMNVESFKNHKNFGENFNFLMHMQIPLEFIADIHTFEYVEEDEWDESDSYLIYEIQKRNFV